MDDPPLLGVDQEHAPRLEPPLDLDLLGRDLEDADLRRHDHEIVVRDDVARGSQPVPVQDGSDSRAVGERDGGGSVPRLHQARVVLVERPLVVGHELVFVPRLRDEHHHRVRQAPPREHEILEGVVDLGRVRGLRSDDGEHLLQVLPEKRRRHHRLAGAHPVDVAPERVDLAVVTEVPEGLCQIPRRPRVRAVALVDQGECALQGRVPQVGVEALDLMGEQEPLVAEGARGEARDVELADLLPAKLDLDPLSDDEELALEGVARLDARAPLDEHLANHRKHPPGPLADRLGVVRHVAPAEHALPLLGTDPLEDLDRSGAPPVVGGEEHDPHAVIARFGEPNACLRGHPLQEPVRHLDEEARAVARVGVRAGGSPVGEVHEHLEPAGDDVVGLSTVDVADEADAAPVVLEAGIVKALSLRSNRLRHVGRFLRQLAGLRRSLRRPRGLFLMEECIGTVGPTGWPGVRRDRRSPARLDRSGGPTNLAEEREECQARRLPPGPSCAPDGTSRKPAWERPFFVRLPP